MSAAGGSDVDSSERRRFRYVILVGPHGARSHAMLKAEVRHLMATGWHALMVYAIHGTGSPHPARIEAAGAEVLIDGPRIYAGMNALDSMSDIQQSLAGSPLTDLAPLIRALHRHQPLLYVVLGNGRYRG